MQCTPALASDENFGENTVVRATNEAGHKDQKRVSDPSSRRKENSFARISETRLRNWLKAYNTFRGGKSHVRLRVFAQGKSRHHRQRHRTGGTTSDSRSGGSNSKKADSSEFSANQDVPRISISADEKRIYGQISEVLERAMYRIVTQRKKDIARRQKELIAMEYQKIKHEREKSSHKSDDAPGSNKTNRSTQDRMERIKKKTLITLDQEKPANQLMPSPAVAKESREILNLFEKVITRPRFKTVRNRETGRRIRVPRVSDERAKSIITDMRSSRYTEGALKDAFNDADVR
ncbi:hypothetical protein KEM56_006694 [Ascosphaera pollenicola]|nr:hypothetical protein KEM56_006694 [Ascosphaera pollenicola]